MRQEIEGVCDPEDPDYDWYYDPKHVIVIARTVYASPSDGNFYRCYDCEAALTDEDGQEFWEAERLCKWLQAGHGLPIPRAEDQDHDKSEE
jgi:hypothetical protein